MVLPLPVGPGGLRFLDLSAHVDFFTRLDAAFPRQLAAARGRAPQPAPLPVERVGAFEASFVPTCADFARLDPRFRIDPRVWEGLGVADRGFAVFQLAGRRSWWRAPKREVHPMGLRFDAPGPGIFFPTLHVHDGAAHPTATFDHTLYLQAAARPFDRVPGFALAWRRGLAPDVGGLVSPGLPLWRAELRGELPNRDLVLPLGRLPDAALVARVARARFGDGAEAAIALLTGASEAGAAPDSAPAPAGPGAAYPPPALAPEDALVALRAAADLAGLRGLLQEADGDWYGRARNPRVFARFGQGEPYDGDEAQALARQDEEEWEAWLASVDR